MDEITTDSIKNVLEYLAKNQYKAKDNDLEAEEVLNVCAVLFAKDYEIQLVSNLNGELSAHYPSQIIISQYEKSSGEHRTNCNLDGVRSESSEPIYESVYDATKLRDHFQRARFARCRGRFSVPVILYDGKHICRSATLSGGPEIYGRTGYDFLFTSVITGERAPQQQVDFDEMQMTLPKTSNEWQLFDRVRSQDIGLLKALSVGYIVDLMVEKKKVKFGVYITSSEKADKESRYSEFSILSLPYPGCEFFSQYRNSGYTAEGLFFDWTQPFVNSNLCLPSDPISAQLDIDWAPYKNWDLVRLTLNYLKVILKYLQEGKQGMLIHCISGWDRTPLFVSLLRLSLWADGTIHRSLNPLQILYLTVAYDWLLFGHNLTDRLNRGEEIMFFCFYFLKHITSDEFSVRKQTKTRVNSKRSDSETTLDGVLLENDQQRFTIRGSNTSLSSNCSSISCRSQDNNAPIFFTTGESSDEMSSSALPTSHYQTPPRPGKPSDPQQTSSPSHGRKYSPNPVHPSSSGSYAKTSPVAVPLRVVRNRSDSSSSVCGSWQIISGTGSLRGSTNCYLGAAEGGNSVAGSQKSTPNGPAVETSTDTGYASVQYYQPQHQSRKERLSAVRTLFYQLYASTVGFKFPRNGCEDPIVTRAPDSKHPPPSVSRVNGRTTCGSASVSGAGGGGGGGGGSGLAAGLLDQFQKKVGIKASSIIVPH